MARPKLSQSAKTEAKNALKGKRRGVSAMPAEDNPMNQAYALAYLVHHPELIKDCMSDPDYAGFKRTCEKLRSFVIPKSPSHRDVYIYLIMSLPKRHVDPDKCGPAPRKQPKTVRGLSIE